MSTNNVIILNPLNRAFKLLLAYEITIIVFMIVFKHDISNVVGFGDFLQLVFVCIFFKNSNNITVGQLLKHDKNYSYLFFIAYHLSLCYESNCESSWAGIGVTCQGKTESSGPTRSYPKCNKNITSTSRAFHLNFYLNNYLNKQPTLLFEFLMYNGFSVYSIKLESRDLKHFI